MITPKVQQDDITVATVVYGEVYGGTSTNTFLLKIKAGDGKFIPSNTLGLMDKFDIKVDGSTADVVSITGDTEKEFIIKLNRIIKGTPEGIEVIVIIPKEVFNPFIAVTKEEIDIKLE